jgi:hypothetical protein
MQKWEYTFVSCEHKKAWRPRWVNDEELPNWKKGPTIYEFSNRLGREGWELVNLDTTSYRGSTYTYRLTFKRPISESAADTEHPES